MGWWWGVGVGFGGGAVARRTPVRPRLKSFTVLAHYSGCNWTAEYTDFTHFWWSKEWTQYLLLFPFFQFLSSTT